MSRLPAPPHAGQGQSTRGSCVQTAAQIRVQTSEHIRDRGAFQAQFMKISAIEVAEQYIHFLFGINHLSEIL